MRAFSQELMFSKRGTNQMTNSMLLLEAVFQLL